MSSPHSVRGFTLVETLVAAGILITALAGIAQLFILGERLARQAGTSGAALLAAQDKLESLRSLAFTYDDGGEAVTAAALEPSPEGSLSLTLEPFADWVDRDGQPQSHAEGAAWLRRWRITSLGDGEPDAITVEVCVFRDVADPGRQPDACLATIRTRQP